MAEIGPLIVDESGNGDTRPYIGPTHVDPKAFPNELSQTDYTKHYWASAEDTAPADEYCFRSNTPYWAEVEKSNQGFDSIQIGEVRYYNCGVLEQQTIFNSIPPPSSTSQTTQNWIVNAAVLFSNIGSAVDGEGVYWRASVARFPIVGPDTRKRGAPILRGIRIDKDGNAETFEENLLSHFPTTTPQGNFPHAEPAHLLYNPDWAPQYRTGSFVLIPQQQGFAFRAVLEWDSLLPAFESGDPVKGSGRGYVLIKIKKNHGQNLSINTEWIMESVAGEVEQYLTPAYENLYPKQQGFYDIGKSFGVYTSPEVNRVRAWDVGGGPASSTLIPDTIVEDSDLLKIMLKSFRADGKANFLLSPEAPPDVPPICLTWNMPGRDLTLGPQWVTDIVADNYTGSQISTLFATSRVSDQSQSCRFTFVTGYSVGFGTFSAVGKYIVTNSSGAVLLEMPVDTETDVNGGPLGRFGEYDSPCFQYDHQEGHGLQRTDDNEFMFERSIYTSSGSGFNTSNEVRKFSADSIISTPSLGPVQVAAFSTPTPRWFPRGQYATFDYSGWS